MGAASGDKAAVDAGEQGLPVARNPALSRQFGQVSKGGEAIVPDPEADYWWPVFDADGNRAATITVNGQDWGRLATARLLAPDVAAHLKVPVADVLVALSRITANLTDLFDSPQGWTVLAEYVQEATQSETNSGHFFVGLH
jgi:hypothetical protein